MNFKKKIIIDDFGRQVPGATIGEHIVSALKSSKTAQNDEQLIAKHKLIEKIKNATDETILTTEEIAVVKQSLYSALLPDDAVWQILAEVAPNDLKQ